MQRTWESEKEVALRAAKRAGDVTLEYFQKGVAVETKSDESPVTIADRTAEERLRETLSHAFPSDGILGEEFGEHVGTSGRKWIVDPIDGTQSFIRGVPFYGVLIGLEEEGEIVVGVMALPALGQTLWATRRGGAFLNGTPIRVSGATSLAEGTILTTDAKPEFYGDKYPAFERLLHASARHRGWGDCYGYALVASGHAELMLDPILSPWDCAPLVPILEEAGGVFVDWKGERTIYGRSGLGMPLALRDEVLRRIESA